MYSHTILRSRKQYSEIFQLSIPPLPHYFSKRFGVWEVRSCGVGYVFVAYLGNDKNLSDILKRIPGIKPLSRASAAVHLVRNLQSLNSRLILLRSIGYGTGLFQPHINDFYSHSTNIINTYHRPTNNIVRL